MWLDNNAVHFISTGAVGTESTVNRTVDTGPRQPVVCPQVVRDYHENMGGVDLYDQLRLQRYSVEMSFRCKKYYKSIILGLVDLVIVNAYISHRKCSTDLGVKSLTRAAFMTQLHDHLVVESASDFEADEIPTPTSSASGIRHTIAQNDAFRVSGKQRMRRRNACKVCSVLFRKEGEKSNETSWYCVQCSEDNKKLFLYNQIRAAQGNTKTRFDVWHRDWRCRVPSTATSSIQMRPSGVKRKRVRRNLLEESNSEEDEDEEEFV